MELNEYQERAMSTCLPACENLPYMLFNLQGEVGELSSKVAKAIRKGKIDVEINHDVIEEKFNGITYHIENTKDYDNMHDFYEALKSELGDVLWQLSGVCSVLGFKLEDVAKSNLAKLASRKQRGVIDGDGDNR